MTVAWEVLNEADVSTWRLKVDGGYLYALGMLHGITMAFVPDIDLTRYQAHLRDAYKQGYADGQEDKKNGVVSDSERLERTDIP